MAILSNEQKSDCDDRSSIITNVHEKKQRSLDIGQIADVSLPNTNASRTSTATTVVEQQSRIDRVLFNLYAEMACAIRCAKSTDDTQSEQSQRVAIRAALKDCLDKFAESQPPALINTIYEYMSKSPCPVANSSQATTHANLPSPVEMSRVDEPLPNAQPPEVAQTPPANNRRNISCASATTSRSTTNLSDLSMHSLQRRFGTDPALHQHPLPHPHAAPPNYFGNVQSTASTHRSPVSDVFDDRSDDNDAEMSSLTPIFPQPIKVEAMSPLPPNTMLFDDNVWSGVVANDSNALHRTASVSSLDSLMSLPRQQSQMHHTSQAQLPMPTQAGGFFDFQMSQNGNVGGMRSWNSATFGQAAPGPTPASQLSQGFTQLSCQLSGNNGSHFGSISNSNSSGNSLRSKLWRAPGQLNLAPLQRQPAQRFAISESSLNSQSQTNGMFVLHMYTMKNISKKIPIKS